jgi:Nitroreductase family
MATIDAISFLPRWTKRVRTDGGGRDPLGLSRVTEAITYHLLQGIITTTDQARPVATTPKTGSAAFCRTSTRMPFRNLRQCLFLRADGIAPDFAVWGNRQTMIAFTTMMWMAEVLGYDTAPMEGFDEGLVKSAFAIPEGVRVVALLAIGHRSGTDKAFAGRLPMAHNFFAEKWGTPIKF